MKYLYAALFLVIASHAAWCQKMEKFYDFNWKETEAGKARFYSLIERTDSGWHRKDYYIHETSLHFSQPE